MILGRIGLVHMWLASASFLHDCGLQIAATPVVFFYSFVAYFSYFFPLLLLVLQLELNSSQPIRECPYFLQVRLPT